jgi:hypothetical protein
VLAAREVVGMGRPGTGNVIVAAGGTLAALAAKQATSALPIVFVAVGDPVTSGLVGSLARPVGNVTGLSLLFPELVPSVWNSSSGPCRASVGSPSLQQPGAVRRILRTSSSTTGGPVSFDQTEYILRLQIMGKHLDAKTAEMSQAIKKAAARDAPRMISSGRRRPRILFRSDRAGGTEVEKKCTGVTC